MATKAKVKDDQYFYDRGYEDGKIVGGKIAEKSATTVKDEFGEVAKVLVIAAGSIVGGLVALTMIWQFIHWAATPDLSSIEGRLSSISQRVDSLYFTQQTSTAITSSGTISIPSGSVCDYTKGLLTCHPQP